MTIREWVQSAKARMTAARVESADLESQLLAAHVLMVDRPWLMAHPEEPFPEYAGESILFRRLSNEPLAYILGWREFYGRMFTVRPGVLIPRQETEVLVDTVLKWFPKRGSEPISILDLGTGSGCIAITLKLENPRLKVVASDISVAALEVAIRNANDLGAEVNFIESDGFNHMGSECFRAIVTNPPYIGLGESIASEVTDYEPRVALFAGQSGLEFFERLAAEAANRLVTEGLLITEVGYRQAQRVADIFRDQGWTVMETVEDLAGIARVVVCKI